MLRRLLFPVLLLGAGQAPAQERDYCPERPGLGTPPCVIGKSHVSIETSLADWTLEKHGPDRTDTVLVGDTLVRIGVSDGVEARVGWAPLGHQYERGSGTTDGVGDVTLGIKASLSHPDGDGLSVALLPFVTLPVGRAPIGAGDWGGGVLLPVSYDLNDAVQLAFTPEIDAAVNSDGRGRHLSYSGTAGVGLKLSDALTLTGETQLERDEDPSGHETHALAALSLALMTSKDLQFDVQAVKGLNRFSPDVELLGGVAVRF